MLLVLMISVSGSIGCVGVEDIADRSSGPAEAHLSSTSERQQMSEAFQGKRSKAPREVDVWNGFGCPGTAHVVSPMLEGCGKDRHLA